MTLRVLPGGGEADHQPPTAQASARVRFDIPTGSVRIDMAANRATIEAMRDGLQALLDSAIPGYFLSVGSAAVPGSTVLTVRMVHLAPEAIRVPEDLPAEDPGVPF